MAIKLKTASEIEQMRGTARVVSDILAKMQRAALIGATTIELDDIARCELEAAGANSNSKGYPTFRPGEGYPGYACISVNEQVVHGVPSSRALVEGDIVTLDMTARLGDFCASKAITFPVGNASAEANRLIEVTRDAVDFAISLVQPLKKWSEIARAIQTHIESNGYNVVREFVGHGIGRRDIEDPKVCHFVNSTTIRSDFKLRPGLTFTIEPMVLMGGREVLLLEDGWTVVAADGKPAAHCRHTVAVTENGADILTADPPAGSS